MLSAYPSMFSVCGPSGANQGSFWVQFGTPNTILGAIWDHMANGVQWSPMGSHGVPWVPMGPHGVPWGPMGSHGVPWDPMGSHGTPMASMENPRMSEIIDFNETHYSVRQKIGDAGSISTQNVNPLQSVTPKRPESPYGAKYALLAENQVFQFWPL